jgi:hypothetical protein
MGYSAAIQRRACMNSDENPPVIDNVIPLQGDRWWRCHLADAYPSPATFALAHNWLLRESLSAMAEVNAAYAAHPEWGAEAQRQEEETERLLRGDPLAAAERRRLREAGHDLRPFLDTGGGAD